METHDKGLARLLGIGTGRAAGGWRGSYGEGEQHESAGGRPGRPGCGEPEAMRVMTPRTGCMARICRIVTAGITVLYGCALGLLAIGTFGLFGAERDPLSGVFLLPLGLPWNLFLENIPDALRPWLAAAAPLLNLLIIWLACRGLGRRAPT
jgi:hypothetical protein